MFGSLTVLHYEVELELNEETWSQGSKHFTHTKPDLKTRINNPTCLEKLL